MQKTQIENGIELLRAGTKKLTCVVCPVCKSADISADEHDGGRTLSERCSCGNCNATWANFYEFCGQEIDT